MANRRDYYYRQKVTESELDAGFDGLENADRAMMSDHELYGIVEGLIVSQHAGTPDLTVDVAAGIAYSRQGERIQVPALQNVDVAVDSNSLTTDVSSPGNSKIVSVFLEFDVALSDPRLDGNSATVFHQRDESFTVVVVQGAEGVSPVPPSLNANRVLLADITRTFGDTQILNAVISPDPTDLADATGRREDLIHVDATPVALRNVVLRGALTSLLTALNDHLTAAANKHDAGDVDAIAQSSGGESVTLGTVESQILELLGIFASYLNLAGGTMTGNLLANSTGIDIGSPSARFDAFIESLTTYASTELGANLTGTEANALIPRLIAAIPDESVEKRTLLLEAPNDNASDSNVRVYLTAVDFVDVDEGIEIVVNAAFNGSTWSRDIVAYATRYVFSLAGLKVTRRDDTSTPWADSGWEDVVEFTSDIGSRAYFEDGRLTFRNASTLSNPSQAVSPLVNTLYAKTLVKAWGHIRIDGSGNVSVIDGFNVQTPANPGGANVLSIAFRNSLDNTTYCVMVQAFSDTGTYQDRFEIVGNLSTGGFDTIAYGLGAQRARNADSGNFHVAFVVLGTDS